MADYTATAGAVLTSSYAASGGPDWTGPTMATLAVVSFVSASGVLFVGTVITPGTTLDVVLNQVFDSVANRRVVWASIGADPSGSYYPRGTGFGTFGVQTSNYACLGHDPTRS